MNYVSRREWLSRTATLAAFALVPRLARGEKPEVLDAGKLPRGREVTTGPKHHWFGYYDKLQFDAAGRRVLGMEVDFEHRSPRIEDEIGIGYADLGDTDASGMPLFRTGLSELRAAARSLGSRHWLAVWPCLGMLCSGSAAADPALQPLDFNRDIRPILSENCFYCHGQDANKREADLRLDDRELAVRAGVIVPGDPGASSLLERIHSTGVDVLMPPPTKHCFIRHPLEGEGLKS